MNIIWSERSIALLTGISIVIMTIVAGIVMGGEFGALFEMTTNEFSNKVHAIRETFIIAILGWIVILITDLIVSWGLYRYYLNQNAKNSLIMGSLRLVYSLILVVAIIQLIRSFGVLSQDSINTTRVYKLLVSFQSIWEFGLIIFGVHLLYLSQLVCKKRSIQQVIAILLFIAGLGYLLSNLADLLIPNYPAYRSAIEVYFILPMILGEFGLALWLIIKGGK